MPTYDVEITRYKTIPQFANRRITAPDADAAKRIADITWDNDAETWRDYGETFFEKNDILVLGEAK